MHAKIIDLSLHQPAECATEFLIHMRMSHHSQGIIATHGRPCDYIRI